MEDSVGTFSHEFIEQEFELIFQKALNGFLFQASFLLLYYNPTPSEGLSNLLLEISKSKWDISDKFIPFYLISQFGRINLKREANVLITSNVLSNSQKERLNSFLYQALQPSAQLLTHYFQWEWEATLSPNGI